MRDGERDTRRASERATATARRQYAAAQQRKAVGKRLVFVGRERKPLPRRLASPPPRTRLARGRERRENTGGGAEAPPWRATREGGEEGSEEGGAHGANDLRSLARPSLVAAAAATTNAQRPHRELTRARALVSSRRARTLNHAPNTLPQVRAKACIWRTSAQTWHRACPSAARPAADTRQPTTTRRRHERHERERAPPNTRECHALWRRTSAPRVTARHTQHKASERASKRTLCRGGRGERTRARGRAGQGEGTRGGGDEATSSSGRGAPEENEWQSERCVGLSLQTPAAPPAAAALFARRSLAAVYLSCLRRCSSVVCAPSISLQPVSARVSVSLFVAPSTGSVSAVSHERPPSSSRHRHRRHVPHNTTATSRSARPRLCTCWPPLAPTAGYRCNHIVVARCVRATGREARGRRTARAAHVGTRASDLGIRASLPLCSLARSLSPPDASNPH